MRDQIFQFQRPVSGGLMLSTGLIGLGYWGSKLLRVLSEMPSVRLVSAFDKYPDNRERAKASFPHIKYCTTDSSLIEDPSIDWIVVATSAASHFDLTARALKAGKHVLVEKPLGLSLSESRQLLELSQEKKRRLLVDHTLLFSPHFETFKSQFVFLSKSGAGLYSARRNHFESTPKDHGVLVHLTYHDLYLLNELVGLENLQLQSSFQESLLDSKFPNFSQVVFSDKRRNFYVIETSLLSPTKERAVLYTTPTRVLTWDDTKKENRVAIFQKRTSESRGQSQLFEEFLPVLNEKKEPLKEMILESIASLSSNRPAKHDAQVAHKVMETLRLIEDKTVFSERKVA